MAAAIVYLTMRQKLPLLERSLALLQVNLLNRFDYPVIVFHEGDFTTKDERRLQQICPSLSLRQVDISPPAHIDISAKGTWKGMPKFPLGYRNMCRFFLLGIQAELSGLDYYLRLDDDSFILSPFVDDPFQRMAENKYAYAYRTAVKESAWAVTGLRQCLAAFDRKLQRCDLQKVYYNNFHMLHLPTWTQSPIADAVAHIDASGGIYTQRWGDHIIQTVLADNYLGPDRVYQFVDFTYKHARLFERQKDAQKR